MVSMWCEWDFEFEFDTTHSRPFDPRPESPCSSWSAPSIPLVLIKRIAVFGDESVPRQVYCLQGESRHKTLTF